MRADRRRAFGAVAEAATLTNCSPSFTFDAMTLIGTDHCSAFQPQVLSEFRAYVHPSGVVQFRNGGNIVMRMSLRLSLPANDPM